MHLLNTIALAILFFHPHTLLQKNSTEGVIINKVASLPEVKSFVEKAKDSKPLIMIAGKPDRDNQYYWIKVGLGNNGMFRTIYNFYVDPKSSEIYYLDFMVDDGDKSSQQLTITQWRHWRKYPAFNKMHKYRNGKLLAL